MAEIYEITVHVYVEQQPYVALKDTTSGYPARWPFVLESGRVEIALRELEDIILTDCLEVPVGVDARMTFHIEGDHVVGRVSSVRLRATGSETSRR